MERFNQILLDRYPEQFAGLQIYDTHDFYNKLLLADISWKTNESSMSTNVSSVFHQILKRSVEEVCSYLRNTKLLSIFT